MTTDDTQQPGPKRSNMNALARAERAVFSRPRPRSARAQMVCELACTAVYRWACGHHAEVVEIGFAIIDGCKAGVFP
ncbi:hypothetical protein [Streptomyces sp. NPDC002402]